MTSEFDLIERYFRPLGCPPGPDVVLGPGDDCALIEVPPDQQLAITVDTLVSGVHFPEHTAAADVGWKSLACSLSDLAAMGAAPAWATLSLVLPQVDEDWLREFANGFAELAQSAGITLIGGDTVHGNELVVTVQAAGQIPAGMALRRDGAQPGDIVYVSGWPGEAAAGLAYPENQALRARLDRPQPRNELGVALRGVASACIDVSDGLAADLRHILEASGVGAEMMDAALPRSRALQQAGSETEVRTWILSGGDDYELCFSIPKNKVNKFNKIYEQFNKSLNITAIGRIEREPGLRLAGPDGQPCPLPDGGYDHFRSRQRGNRV